MRTAIRFRRCIMRPALAPVPTGRPALDLTGRRTRRGSSGRGRWRPRAAEAAEGAWPPPLRQLQLELELVSVGGRRDGRAEEEGHKGEDQGQDAWRPQDEDEHHYAGQTAPMTTTGTAAGGGHEKKGMMEKIKEKLPGGGH
uniref:Uncharacterized protein n=1 Tax=Ananas comosus var. bracteatus TaxID=296719 RepID=A0A6V7PVU5_ANACO|nr:unnamed protein product [Ananas comosus var. bracteatus]